MSCNVNKTIKTSLNLGPRGYNVMIGGHATAYFLHDPATIGMLQFRIAQYIKRPLGRGSKFYDATSSENTPE
jgi:hypothetical protein